MSARGNVGARQWRPEARSARGQGRREGDICLICDAGAKTTLACSERVDPMLIGGHVRSLVSLQTATPASYHVRAVPIGTFLFRSERFHFDLIQILPIEQAEASRC